MNDNKSIFPIRYLLLLSTLACTSAQATPLLRCQATYAGATQTIEATPTTDPYSVESVDIGGRFRFKAVVTAKDNQIDVIKLYAYYETRRQPVLLQEVKYTAPFTLSDAPNALTGVQTLFSPPLGRELQYGCTLTEKKS